MTEAIPQHKAKLPMEEIKEEEELRMQKASILALEKNAEEEKASVPLTP